jgi:hypothetical protein
MLLEAADSQKSAARFVGWLERKTCWLKKDTTVNQPKFYTQLNQNEICKNL